LPSARIHSRSPANRVEDPPRRFIRRRAVIDGGVAEAARFGRGLGGVTVAIQGVGYVGAYLAE
jgi:hypothetical protein